MKHFWQIIVCFLLGMTLAGCMGPKDPIYFEELSDAERIELMNQAKLLALQSQAMPEMLRDVFAEMQPSERIVYSGDKEGKASYRWEIYGPEPEGRITQQDVNPYWVMVYAEGDLTDPSWKISHARLDDTVFAKIEEAQKQQSAAQTQSSDTPTTDDKATVPAKPAQKKTRKVVRRTNKQ